MSARVPPQVTEVVRFLHDRNLLPREDVLEILEDIAREQPGLSFENFIVALRIAAIGNAPAGPEGTIQ